MTIENHQELDMPPQPTVGLTTKQLQVFNYITKYMGEHRNMTPTLREIARGLPLSSHGQAFRFVNILVDKGYLSKVHNAHQSIEIIKYPIGGAPPSTGVPRSADNEDLEIARAAYARGVREGRRLERTETTREIYDRGYVRGIREAKKLWPADRVQAFERGIVFGKEELRRELTLRKYDAE